MAYGQHILSRMHVHQKFTSGDLSFSSNVPAAINTAFDLTIPAQVGDTLCYTANIHGNANSDFVAFDVYTLVSGSTVNSFGAGLDTGLATYSGISAWLSPPGTYIILSGRAFYTVQSGDIDSSGLVTCRIYRGKTGGGSRTIYCTTGNPLFLGLENIGPQYGN